MYSPDRVRYSSLAFIRFWPFFAQLRRCGQQVCERRCSTCSLRKSSAQRGSDKEKWIRKLPQRRSDTVGNSYQFCAGRDCTTRQLANGTILRNSGRRTVRLKSKGDDGLNPWIRPRPSNGASFASRNTSLAGVGVFSFFGPVMLTAQVSENVYDTPTGKYLLIPQGARLIGQYDSQIAFGQSRVLLVWTRLIMPNGKSIVLERQPGADTSGYSGPEDEVDNHWGALLKAALLSTLLSVGSEAGTTGNQNDLVQAIRRGGSESFNQVGQRVVSRNLDIQPTLTIRPGFPVRVIVNRDLVLEPYRR